MSNEPDDADDDREDGVDDDELDDLDDELVDDDEDDDLPEVVEDEVVYDLTSWTLAQRAVLQSHLVSYGLAHAWVGRELSVKVDDEAAADELIAAVDEGREPGEVEGGSFDGGEEVVYELDDWEPGQRTLLATRLDAAGVPHDFEDDGALVVPVAWEEAVEALLEEVEFPDALADEGPDPGEGGADGDAELDDPGALPPVPGETLSELFLAADRLLHDTGDVAGLEGLDRALDAIGAGSAPYGVSVAMWKRVGEVADDLAEQLAEGNEDDAIDRATTLRGLLRPYV